MIVLAILFLGLNGLLASTNNVTLSIKVDRVKQSIINNTICLSADYTVSNKSTNPIKIITFYPMYSKGLSLYYINDASKKQSLPSIITENTVITPGYIPFIQPNTTVVNKAFFPVTDFSEKNNGKIIAKIRVCENIDGKYIHYDIYSQPIVY